MAISPDLWKLIHAFGDAADDVGAIYADTIHSKKERDAATKRMVAARAALVAAIEAEVASEREACAKLVELPMAPEAIMDFDTLQEAARMIRARSQP